MADAAKVNKDQLKATAGVMGVVGSGNQCHVVIGNDVIEVYDEIMKTAKFSGSANAATATGEKKKFGAMVLDFLVGVFQPLVPAIAGGGILKAFLSLFALIGWMDKGSALYQALIAVADAPLYFLPVLVAVTMSTKLKCNRLVSVATVGALLMPATTSLTGGETPAVLFGITLQKITYVIASWLAICSS